MSTITNISSISLPPPSFSTSLPPTTHIPTHFHKTTHMQINWREGGFLNKNWKKAHKPEQSNNAFETKPRHYKKRKLQIPSVRPTPTPPPSPHLQITPHPSDPPRKHLSEWLPVAHIPLTQKTHRHRQIPWVLHGRSSRIRRTHTQKRYILHHARLTLQPQKNMDDIRYTYGHQQPRSTADPLGVIQTQDRKMNFKRGWEYPLEITPL